VNVYGPEFWPLFWDIGDLKYLHGWFFSLSSSSSLALDLFCGSCAVAAKVAKIIYTVRSADNHEEME